MHSTTRSAVSYGGVVGVLCVHYSPSLDSSRMSKKMCLSPILYSDKAMGASNVNRERKHVGLRREWEGNLDNIYVAKLFTSSIIGYVENTQTGKNLRTHTDR